MRVWRKPDTRSGPGCWATRRCLRSGSLDNITHLRTTEYVVVDKADNDGLFRALRVGGGTEWAEFRLDEVAPQSRSEVKPGQLFIVNEQYRDTVGHRYHEWEIRF